MTKTVIRVENVSKQYRLGQIGTGSLAHDVNRWWYGIRGKENPYLKIGEKNDRTIKSQSSYVWALRDISFDVKQGEVLGIIGRNGAGKSTLLKILSRTTLPTTGNIKVKGRIASLLEVGTGFHPELTGRENIFLNGAILGMTRHEIKAKFDEIVDFAGIEKYIDTPVKRYSSGMYVRLAFAVAAHLEPEILIVDEVLAVGDAEFQKKCLGKMQDISSNEGRTVLFVSHSMGSIVQLCTKAILLKQGQIEKTGATSSVVEYYLQSTYSSSNFFAEAGIKDMAIVEAFTKNLNDETTSAFKHNEKILIVSRIKVRNFIHGSEFRLVARDRNGKAIFTSDLELGREFAIGDYFEITAEIPESFLRPGNIILTFAIFIPHRLIIDLQENVLPLTIIDGGSNYASSEGLDYGYIFFKPQWSIKPVEHQIVPIN